MIFKWEISHKDGKRSSISHNWLCKHFPAETAKNVIWQEQPLAGPGSLWLSVITV